jgi:hypothetical protein
MDDPEKENAGCPVSTQAGMANPRLRELTACGLRSCRGSCGLFGESRDSAVTKCVEAQRAFLVRDRVSWL